MRELIRPALLICLVMLVPILPFLAFGESMELWTTLWFENERSIPILSAGVILVLSTDIFLPIPSSMVSTFGGMWLGTLGGSIVSWLGMTLGALIGFVLARLWGRPFAGWFSRAEDLHRMQGIIARYGPTALLVARGVPVLAEASVLLTGMHGLAWNRFLPPVLLGNLVLSLAYSAIGEVADRNDWLWLALVMSIVLPILLAAVFARWFPPEANADDAAPASCDEGR